MTRGWVLTGFPLNATHANNLMRSGCEPNRVFFIDVCDLRAYCIYAHSQQTPDDVLIERLSLRRVDPVTGQQYHLLDAPPSSVEIQNRLVQVSPSPRVDHTLTHFPEPRRQRA